MSSADEAFDKLLGRNALAIPVANPAADTRVRRTADSVPPASPLPAANAGTNSATNSAANGSSSGDMSEAMRVLDLLDENSGDYNPRHYSSDESDRLFSTPTETELSPVGGEDEPPTAAHIVTPVVDNSVDDSDFPEAEADVVDDDDEDSANGGGANGGDTQIDIGGDADLKKARRLRRFSYLPLGDMEIFENRARDVMASLASQAPDLPSLAITSPARGDGRTELAIRLALAMAKRVDYRVLLADFDIRKPRIAARLGLSSKYFTLSDVLRGSCPLGEALMVSEEDNLYVLPARAPDRDGDEVLSDKQVQALMARIHASFDFAVVACGTADNADAAIVCRHAGATALAARCRRTRAKALRDAADRLADAGANVVGMLLTGA